MATETEVRDASKRFYSALNAMVGGKNAPMADAWAHDASVSAMHPIGGRDSGWDQVRSSFEGVGSMAIITESGIPHALRFISLHDAPYLKQL